MATAQILYDFTSNLSPTSVSSGWSSSAPITEVGSGVITRQATDGGIMRFDSASGSKTQTTAYITITFGPDDPTLEWTPTSFSMRSRRSGSSGIEMRIRRSVGGYSTGNQETFVLGSSYVDYVHDLSDIGPITGDLTLRLYGYQQFGGNYQYFDTLTLDASYVEPTVDQDITDPTSIGSAEAFGSPTVSPGAVDLAPGGIASAEAVGSPTLSVVSVVQPAGIASSEAFGTNFVSVDQSIAANGVASAEAFDDPTVAVIDLTQTLTTEGIPSAEAFDGTIVSYSTSLSGAFEFPFTANLNPAVTTPGFTISSPADVGAGSVAWQSSGWMRNVGGTTSQTQTTNYWTITITPDDPAMPWTPQSFYTSAKRTHTSTSQGFRVRTSADGFAANAYSYFGLGSSFSPHYVNLAGIGEITGPLEIRVYPTTGTTGAYLDFDFVNIGFVYKVDGVYDVTLDSPNLPSAEAFGAPLVFIIQPINLSAESIISGEAFGEPIVQYGAPVEVVGYPDGEEIAAFLGAPDDADLIAMAEIHVGVITHFARVYTRGNGFYIDGVPPEIGAVILAATARLVANPDQIDITIGSVRRQTSFKGWTLAEQKALNPYRKVAS